MAKEAAGVLQEIRNVVLKPRAENIPRIIYAVGTYEAGKTIVDNVPVRSLNSVSTGALYGFGSMLHRLHLQAERGSGGSIEYWNIPQPEAGGSAAAVGEIDFTGSTGVQAGTLYLYCGFDLIRVSIVKDMTIEQIADAVVAAINGNRDLNITAAKVLVTFEVTITSKTLGDWGNYNKLSLNREPGQETPDGIIVAFTQPTGGVGLPDIQDALDAKGVGDAANEGGATVLIHGYGQDSTTLDAIADYVGQGDQFIGLYKKEVARPFYSVIGDVVGGDIGLNDLTDLGDLRANDRATEIFPVPGSKSHPSEIAAQIAGHQERIARVRPAEGYTNIPLTRIDPGDLADRWTSNRDNRTLAVQHGISSSLVKKQTVYIKDTITTYHPDSIPDTSNIYSEIVNICKIQNMLASLRTTFETDTFNGAIIVQDANRVASIVARQKVIDIDIVRAILYALIDAWQDEAWLFETDFAKANLDVALRAGTDGFNSIITAILSGLNKINDNEIQADVSTAVLA